MTDEKIDNDELKKREPIDFYEQVHLFEDELDDHGCAQLAVRVRWVKGVFEKTYSLFPFAGQCQADGCARAVTS